MFRVKKIVQPVAVSTFSQVEVGQSFTTDGEVWLRVNNETLRNGNTFNAVRISAQARRGSPRYRLFSANENAHNINEYGLVHSSRIPDLV